MSFLLNLFNSNQLSADAALSILFVSVSLVLSVVIAAAYSVSKKFIDAEFVKLKNDEHNKFDRIIATGFAAILSMVIVIVSMLLLRVGLSSYADTTSLFPEIYYQLMVFFAVFLVVTYALLSPKNENFRFFSFSNYEAKTLFRKLSRMAATSIAVIVVETGISLLLHNDLAYHCDYVFGMIITAYYFFEIYSAHALLKKCLHIDVIPDLRSLSAKLVMFINKKFPIMLLIGMIAIITVNYLSPTSRVTFLEHLKDILCVLVSMSVVQAIISRVLSVVFDKLRNITVGIHSKRTVISRRKNLMWICDVLILFVYVSLICVVPQYFGIQIHDYIFHDKIMIIVWVVFITIISFRAFNEFIETILEKRAEREDAKSMRLETFMPILSTMFNIVLFGTALLIILSSLGVNIAPILATFTIGGASVSLAAKEIIRSFLQGVVLLFEKDLYAGEFVKINDVTGIVERLSIRVMYLRDVNGSLYVIPYGSIGMIVNYSKDYTWCFFGLHINENSDVGKISELIIESVREVKEQDDDYRNEILSDASIFGLKAFDLSGPELEWGVKMNPGPKSSNVQYRVYTRLYEKFKKHGISLPSTNLVIPSKS